MGTGTLFGHRSKAAASCRTPNASRLPTPIACAAVREKPLGSAARFNGAIWGQTRCLGMKTKRQQAAALQALRAYQRPVHPRRRVGNHRDQRRDRMGPYGDRHVVGSERHMPSLGAGAKRWGTKFKTRKLSVLRKCARPIQDLEDWPFSRRALT